MNSKAFRIFARTSLLVLALTLACAGAAKADTFQNGQFVTYDQVAWSGGVGATVLASNYASVYAGTFGIVTLGVPSTGFTLSFDGSGKVLAYFPAGGPPAPLNANLVDPSGSGSSAPGGFGGDVLALQLDVDYSKAGFLGGTSNIPFGNLVLQNLSACTAADGLTVSQFLADANTALGGGAQICGIGALDTLAVNLGESFIAGVPSTFAQNTLTLPTSATVPEPSSVLLLGAGMLGLGIFQFRRRGSTSSALG